ncbi:hypothetical protein ACFOOM_06310 [Streptomyces echinoruber]|uniref:Secreted protein n=1 Tax=Streptomyces echinoruber TaxID=68898 RepID=A0A918QZT0_9ACTN|nr:hypothetical protein [Streptomyces echinoruber]GGZ78506.1 hypothetical protein GCM10010389_15050 [Streptomyces echinoruber]
MKPLKAAAVVAGTIVLVGAAAPAFAYDTPDEAPTSLNGAVNSLTKGRIQVTPLQHQSDALDTENKNSVLSHVKDVTTALNQNENLLGGLPLRG